MTEELTKKEILQYRDVFDMIDKNGDGTICTEELGKAMRLAGQNPSDIEIKEIMEAEDTDGNGTLDFDEFLRLMLKRKLAVPDPEEELRAAFRVFDRDDNGYITADELKLVMCELGEKLSEEEFNDLMEIMDVNGDGHIDIEEFIQMSRAGGLTADDDSSDSEDEADQ